MKYVKKSIVVEAHPVPAQGCPPTCTVGAGFRQWCIRVGFTEMLNKETGCIAINTLEGVMTASPGDYIIQGLQGEFYPCKPDIFLASYERVK